MKNQEITKEQLISFSKNHWKVLLPGGLIVIALVVFIVMLSLNKGVKNSPAANNKNNNSISFPNANPTKKPFNPLNIFGNEDSRPSITPTPPSKGLKNIHSGNLSAPLPSVVTKIAANGTKTTQPLSGGGSVQTAQGTVTANSNIQTGVESNTQQDNIAIVFQNPDGTTTTYIPPGTPPDDVRWGRYTNTQAKYSINYPSNWQFVYSTINGHEGVALYPPGENPSDPNSHYIGFGMTDVFLLPVAGDTADALKTPIIVDGINGDLYTDGPLGDSYIASVMQYSGKYFGLGSSKSDATFAYVYYFMLYSLTFDVE